MGQLAAAQRQAEHVRRADDDPGRGEVARRFEDEWRRRIGARCQHPERAGEHRSCRRDATRCGHGGGRGARGGGGACCPARAIAQRRARAGHRPGRRAGPACRTAQAQGVGGVGSGRGGQRRASARPARAGLHRPERPGRGAPGKQLPDAQDAVHCCRGAARAAGRRRADEARRRERRTETGAHLHARAGRLPAVGFRRSHQHRRCRAAAHPVPATHPRRQQPAGRVEVLQHLHRPGRLHRREEVPEDFLRRHREGQGGSREGRRRRLDRHDPALFRLGLDPDREGAARVLHAQDRQQPVRGGRTGAAGRSGPEREHHREHPAADRAAGPAHAGEDRARARPHRRLRLAHGDRQADLLAAAVPARHRRQLGLGDRAAHHRDQDRILPAVRRRATSRWRG